MPLEPERKVLNFIVTGQVRCGLSVVQSAITSHPDVTCHGELLNADLRVRQDAHDGYFGESAPIPDHVDLEDEEAFSPGFCYPGLISPEQYLTGRVFDNALYGEQAIGVKIQYNDVLREQLWEYFQSWCRAGDFCLIHVKRNPVACFVSLKQAEQTGIWWESVNGQRTNSRPYPVHVDLDELIPFVRNHLTCECKVTNTCDDRLELHYKELFLNYPEVMAGIFNFLGLPPFPEAQPSIRRLKNRRMEERIQNFVSLKFDAPSEIKEFLTTDLF